MRPLELVIAGLFAFGGVRSLWVWSRRSFEGADARDHALYGVYVACRVGLWFAFAGFFLGYALIEEVEPFRWYVMLPIGLSAGQLLAGFALGNRSSD